MTSAASREERVFHPHREESAKKKQRKDKDGDDKDKATKKGKNDKGELFGDTVAEKHDKATKAATSMTTKDDDLDVTEATFSEELDLANDRNASELFGQFYRQVWPLARSLPEVLHHATKIVDACLEYLMSNEAAPHVKSTTGTLATSKTSSNNAKRERFILNHATTDILHLLAVLGKDLRHEIHPYLHDKIIPRIVTDLLNQPTTSMMSMSTAIVAMDVDDNDNVDEEDKEEEEEPAPPVDQQQFMPIDVSIIEASFRTLSYIFRYDADALLAEVETGSKNADPCLEKLRQYYGSTLAHRRDVVRRLAAETFAPLVRKLRNENARRRHLRRVVRALMTTVSASSGGAGGIGSKTARVMRLHANAIDGIAQLFFEVARGVAGQLNSKGKVAAKVLLDVLCSSDGKNDSSMTPATRAVAHSVMKSFLEKLCYHLHRKQMGEILGDIVSTTQRVFKLAQDKGASKGFDFGPHQYMLQILSQMVHLRSGSLLEHNRDEQKYNCRGELSKVVVRVLDVMVPLFPKLPMAVQKALLSLLNSTWKAIPSDPYFARQVKKHIDGIVQCHPDTPTDDALEAIEHPAQVFARDLVPYLPPTTGMGIVGTSILSAAAEVVDKDSELCLSLVLSVAKSTPVEDTEDNKSSDPEDSLFSLERATQCRISPATKERLLGACLLDVKDSKDDPSKISKLGVAALCISFLALVGVKEEDDEQDEKSLKQSFDKASKWLLQVFNLCANRMEQEHNDRQDNSIVASLALESLARLSMDFHRRDISVPSIKKILCKVQPAAEKMLLSDPASHWTLRSVSAFVEGLQLFNLMLDEKDAIFDALVPNLRNPSHFRRLYSLQILGSLPPKLFVTDHADLDLADDLDEEQDENAVKPESTMGRVARAGLCDIMETLTSIESTSIEFHNERHLLNLISRVEILGRTTKLPAVYTEAAANHMLGILYIKFSPIWPAAVRAFVSLATGQDFLVWASLKDELMKLMSKMPVSLKEMLRGVAPVKGETVDAFSRHHGQCKVWDESDGTDPSLFGRDMTQRLPTDEAMVLQHLWSVLEGAPELLAKNSREIIPIVLQFMHSQFYARYPHDPDASELRIEDHIEDTTKFDRDYLQGHIVHQRLISILKVFAAIKGPKQLFKHGLLLSIFKSLLSQDIKVARLALACVATYKIPAVVAFSGAIEGLLAKGSLKEGLLKFNTALETTPIDKKNRSSLLPIVMRVVFGRLSARSGSKSSKDSPAARRAAVLSFIALLCESEDDLYPFVYLMVRNYVPDRSLLIPIDQQEPNTRKEILASVVSVSIDTVSSLPTQAHIGFLYLLEPVTRQLGHRLTNFVNQFTSIVLSLCKLAEVKEVAPSEFENDNDGAENDDNGDDNEEGDDNNDGGAGSEGGQEYQTSTKGFNALRTLGFRRLAELFSQFAQVKDFSECGPRMWDAIKVSVDMLPSTVVLCAKVPASLSLLLKISSHEQLVPLLTMYGEAVPCAIKCLADTSTHPVIDATLSLIDNLLAYDEDRAASANAFVIRDHVDLILRQFMVRIGGKAIAIPAESQGKGHHSGKKPMRSQTWRRELRILCRITEIIEHDETSVEAFNRNEVAEKLCTLLAPYLKPGNFIAEPDQMNVLNILEALMPKVGTIAGSTHFEQMSQLLGPMKGKPGIVSPMLRRGIAATLSKAPQEAQSEANKVADVLQQLCKTHKKRVDELDYDVVIPAVVALSDSESASSWLALATTAESGPDIKLISPLLFTCFHYLFNDDGIVSRGAFKALKNLIRLAAEHADFDAERVEGDQSEAGQWDTLLEKYLAPAIRMGLTTRHAIARRSYILLMSEIARGCKGSTRPNLYGDLAVLIRDDDPDLDFFFNMTHVQLHRRTRAFQRLRKALAPSEECTTERPFTLQSLSNVLLPLAMHPIYESKKRDEEHLAIEAIATVGAISRHLSWSKYNNILWTSLTQFDRHEEQERYLVGMICALIDGFHFEISTPAESNLGGDTAVEDSTTGTAVWRALERRFIPKIESLLTKEKTDKSGTKTKILRSSLILALVKLFKKCSKSIFKAKLPRLLTVTCNGLKSRESDARDLARNTLAKIVVDIEMDYLPDVLREVTIALREGYRLHVRIATVHSLLLAISKKYTPSKDCTDREAIGLPFDKSVPALMDIIQQDLFGAAQERKDVEGVQGRFVKEAGGCKSHNLIELVSSLILFRPSLARDHGDIYSSVHAVVSPLVERLKEPNVDVKTIRRIKECLSRVVAGLTRNPTVSVEEVLPFVYATASPFIGNADFTAALFENSDDEDDDEEMVKAIQVTGSSKKQATGNKPTKVKKGTVAAWQPSTLKSSKTSRGAANVRLNEAKALRKVRDGVSAPKLTGSSRYTLSSAASKSKINEPANIAAVVFSLRLLSSVLKKRKTPPTPELIALVDPFIPLLTACVCTCRETDVVLLALRCLGIFLYFDVPSKEACAPALGTKTLDLLSSSGVGSNENNELSQACFKMLIMLMNLDRSKNNGGSVDSAMVLEGEDVMSKSSAMPLDSEQMKVLISFLQEAIVDTENHNAALNLIKSIMSRRFVSPEFYDLMDTVLELCVKSHKAPLRQHCCGIVINYLLNYPLGEERLEQHLKQVVVNVKYEFEEGRLTGIHLVTMIVEKIPQPALEKYVQLFFLPLTLQLVNDGSQRCREGVANCLTRLVRRVSTEVAQSLFDFAMRWSRGGIEVQKASLQLFGIFVDSREDFLKRGKIVSQLVERIKDILVDKSLDETNWETFYFSLLCLDKLTKPFPDILATEVEIWVPITKCLAHPHHFLKLVSSRLINHHLEPLDALTFANKKGGSKTFLVEQPGSLYEVARNLCYQLNVEEHYQNDEVTTLCIKALCWLLPAMKENPDLCYSNNSEIDDDSKDPVGWVMKRLSNVARPRGPIRRQAVFKAFAAFATVCPAVVFPTHLEAMLEPLHRVDIETVNDVERPSLGQSDRRRRSEPSTGSSLPAEAILARDALRLLEDQCEPPEVFLTALAVVKTRAREKKEARQLEITSEAVRDPKAAAKRRQEKNERGKQRKKRRVDEHRQHRGGVARRRYDDD